MRSNDLLPQPDFDPPSSRVIGNRFEILDQSALGGMAEVRRAWDRWNNVYVALKRLRTLASVETERFRREAAVLRELQHPAIVAHVGQGELASGEFYLVMEWLEGEDLDSRLARGHTLEIADCVTLGLRVTDALAAAHSRGIIHRDIKPSNLFLESGRVDRTKVLDFGLARFMGASQVLTRAGTAVGTPAYMAPEQVLAQSRVDTRADVWSLGCVLYECLTGAPPFNGDQLSVVFLKILQETPKRVRETRPDVPEALDDLIARMLLKEPSERPRDGEVVREELRRIQVVAPVRTDGAIGLGRAEQRIMAFVVASPADTSSPAELTSTMPEAELLAGGRAARAVVESHGGELSTMPDGTVVVSMASKGTASDLAKQAARCALALRNEWPDGQIAIAIGAGDSAARRPVSEALEKVAALMEQARGQARAATTGYPGTPPGSGGGRPIRIDDTVAGLLDAGFEVTGDGHGLLLVSERSTSDRPRMLGVLTSCVGRDRELAALRGIFEEVVAEPIARFVLLTGPAGIGKTRLCQEFLAAIENAADPVAVWHGRGQPTTAGAPLAMLASGLAAFAHLDATEPVEVRQHKLLARASRSLPDDRARAVCEFLAELVRAPFDDADRPALRAARHDPSLMNQRIRAAWEELLTAESATQPVVLVLEDLHWGDAGTAKFVDGALRKLANRPLLVLGTARASSALEAFPDLVGERAPHETRLGPLTPKASEKLVRAILGENTPVIDVQRISERSGGNPLFLEELIRARLRGDAVDLPQTLLAMTQSRLERLDLEPRRALRAASILGLTFSEEAVGALLGEVSVTGNVARSLEYLAEAELVDPRPDALGGVREYSFRQEMTRSAAYSMLTEDDRRIGHRIAARWLVDKAAGAAAEIAVHFDRGGEPTMAARWYLTASEDAMVAADHEAVSRWTDRAIALGAVGETLGTLLGLQVGMCMLQNELSRAEEVGVRSLELLPPGGPTWCRVAGDLGMVGQLARPGTTGGILRRLVDEAPAADAAAAHALAISGIALTYARVGKRETLARLVEVAEGSAAKLASVDAAVHGRVALARSYLAGSHDGDVAGHLRHAREAQRAYSHVGAPIYTVLTTSEVGWALLAAGAYESAEENLHAAVEYGKRMRMPYLAACMEIYQSLAIGFLGEHARAVALVREAHPMCRGPLMDKLASMVLARIYLLAGDYDSAEQAAAAFDVGAGPESLIEAEVLVTLATVKIAKMRGPEALALTTRAMRWLGENGGIGHIEGLLRVVHARALELTGALVEARAALETAGARLHERAASIDDPALAKSFLERVPENARTFELLARR